MLKQLKLKNFRGFEEHELPFNKLTVIVGRNNAGKSTIVEALRLLALVSSRFRHLTFYLPPDWSGLPRRCMGVSPSLKNLEINFDSLFHQYGEPPAEITATFTNNATVTIYIAGEAKIHAVIRDAQNNIVNSSATAKTIEIPSVSIMPQVGPVAQHEVVLSPEYVRSAVSSRLASLHFRNQLNLFYELFKDFQGAVQDTWPGVRVEELIGRNGLPHRPLHLEVRNDDFVADVADMGHGLQMWLQTMWFLTREKSTSTVILDEPDVYMHADLQRRLIRFLRNKFPQLIIATHSVEIIAEVEPEEILVVDRKKNTSDFATTLPSVQRIVETIGSAHNIHLARLWNAKRILLVEGKDVAILKRIQDSLFPDSKLPFDVVPNMPIGGWGGWNYAVGSSMVLKNAVGEKVTTYCVLDSDYHTTAQLQKRLHEAAERGVQLHIWKRKEIENYLLVPNAIARLIQGRAGSTANPSASEVAEKLQELATTLENDCFDATAAEVLAQDRTLGAGGANKEARRIIDGRKKTCGLLDLVSGKGLLAKLAEWSQEVYGVSFSTAAIARALRPSEINEELRTIVEKIEGNKLFS